MTKLGILNPFPVSNATEPDVYVGAVTEFENVVPLYPFPDLSRIVAILLPELNVIRELSAPSNHNAHPGILRGSNPEMLFDSPSIACLEQNIIGG